MISNQRIVTSSTLRTFIERLSLIVCSQNSQSCEVNDTTSKKGKPISHQNQLVQHLPKIHSMSPVTHSSYFRFSTSSPQAQLRPIISKHLSILLNQHKQSTLLLQLLGNLIQTSHQSHLQAQKSLPTPRQTLNKILISPLNQLGVLLSEFIGEVEKQKMVEVEKWKSQEIKDRSKHYRENLLIEIEERKLFYERLQSFVNSVSKQLQFIALGHKNQPQQHLPAHQQTQDPPAHQQTQPNHPHSIISGELFKQNFLADHSNQLYDKIQLTQQDYLLKSQKLRSFNLFNIKSYQPNLCIKLRLLLKVLGTVKTTYQLHLSTGLSLSLSTGLSLSLSTGLSLSLTTFLSQKIICPLEYADLIACYFSQFSQENLKNHISLSIGYHSDDISELSKELIDVKIKETNVRHDLTKMAVLIIQQDEWLFNGMADEGSVENGSKNEDFESKDSSGSKSYSEDAVIYRYTNNFSTHKQHILTYAKLAISQLKRQKHKQSNQHILNQPLDESKSISSIPSYQSPITSSFYQSQYSLTFNKLLPHRFFTITDIVQLQVLIKEQIIPLMVDPFEVYGKIREVMESEKSKDSVQVNVREGQYTYDRLVRELLRQMEQNMLFLSRFLQWNIHLLISYKHFLTSFYQTPQIIQYLTQLFSPSSNSSTPNQNSSTPNSITCLHHFLRIANILHHLLNDINPIYIEDYIMAIDQLHKNFKHWVQNHICKGLGVTPIELLRVVDDRLLVQLVTEKGEGAFCASMLRFRLLAVFLDTQLITYPEFFTLLLRHCPENPTHKDLSISPFLSYIYYSNGLEKTLYQLSEFRDKKTYKQYSTSNKSFQIFQQLIYTYQHNFNLMINSLTNMELHQSSGQQGQIKQKEKDFPKFYSKHPKTKLSQSFNLSDFTLNTDNLHSTLAHYKENDLVDTSSLMDEQTFINYLSQLHLNTQMQESQKTRPQSPPKITHHNDFTSPLNILTILSQHSNFLSSTMQMTYFTYVKSIIQQIHTFDTFIPTWNFPFNSDFALQKNKLSNQSKCRLYIKLLPSLGVKGRSRFFRDDLSTKKDFMRINQFNDHEGKERQFEKIETKRKVLGVISKDRQIIQLGILINRANQVVTVVSDWLQDQLEIIDRSKHQEQFSEVQ